LIIYIFVKAAQEKMASSPRHNNSDNTPVVL